MSGDDYLQEVRAEGRTVSSGKFTLDSQSMLAKLGKHQLPSADYYVLKFVQSAVAGGATYIRFKTSGAGKEITFDGQPWLSDELARLSQYVLGDHNGGRHLTHLAVGLQAMLALAPTHWELYSSEGGLTAWGAAPKSGASVNTIRVHWGRGLGKLAASLALRFFWRGRGLLFKRAKLAPITVTLDSSYVNRHAGVWSLRRSFDVPHHVMMEADTDAHHFTYFLPLDGPGEIMGAARSVCREVRWFRGELLEPETWEQLFPEVGGGYQKVSAPGQCLAGVGYAGLPALGCAALVKQRSPVVGDTQLVLISDGVALDSERLTDFPRGYRLWVSARGLGIDLSHFKVIKDERYDRLLQSLARLTSTL